VHVGVDEITLLVVDVVVEYDYENMTVRICFLVGKCHSRVDSFTYRASQ
jgi:hypothetical protein